MPDAEQLINDIYGQGAILNNEPGPEIDRLLARYRLFEPVVPVNWLDANQLYRPAALYEAAIQDADLMGDNIQVKPLSKYAQNLTEDAQEAAIAEASASGLNVIKSDPYTFLLDIDTIRDRKQFDKGYALAREIFPNWGWSYEEWESKSGNTHIKVSVPGAKSKNGSELSIMARLAIEMCLGSDRTRGLYGIAKILNRIGNPEEASVLFKPEAKTVSEADEEDDV